MSVLLGGYTPEMDGRAAGIGLLSSAGYQPVLGVEGSPSWLAWHPSLPVLYAALEGAGAVQAFSRRPSGALAASGEPVPVGEAVCHVTVVPDGSALIACCYGDGRLVRVALDASGTPGRALVGTAATDPYPEPDRAPHAHQARVTPAGLVSTDLGFDQVRIWQSSPGTLAETARVALPRGTGPRHTLWHPSGHLFVVTEYSNEIFVLRPEPRGSWQLVAGVALPGTQAGADFPAEIASSRDGRFVYVGVRGSNTIDTVAVRGEGTELRPVARVESGVDWPRHHLLLDDRFLVAGQRSNEVTELAVDGRTGVPGRVRARWEVPTPTCLVESPAR